MIDAETVGTRLIQLRAKQLMTAAEAARRSGLGASTIYELEAGRVKDYRLLGHIVPLCKAYGCSVQMFIASVEGGGV
jgi:transcriptional regulator with XRE-family HTH domain